MNPKNEVESAVLEIMLSEFGHKPVAALQNCMVRIAAYIEKREKAREPVSKPITLTPTRKGA